MTKKDITIKFLVEISRILLGVTFVFSGFVKTVDPFGTAYKIGDYFIAFNLSSLSFLSFPISALQSVVEFVAGAFMLLGIYRKWNSRIIFAIMCFMTPLTFYLAMANPVQDCGCFGDAWIITNWQTFYKNIILLSCAVCVLLYRERISNFFTGKTYWLAFLYIIIFISLFVFRNYLYDPVIDFRPYKIGSNIPQLMDVKEGTGREEIMTLTYAKDGVEKEFTEDNYPWEDTTWVFVKTNIKVIKEGEKPLIKDFSITQLLFDQSMTNVIAQTDITHDILSDTNYVFLMVSPSLTKMRSSYLSSFEDVENYAHDNQYGFYCLTASTTDEIIAWANENTIKFNFCTTDERTLKTMIRTNPGLLLLKNGIVINKWADINVPAEEGLTKPLEQLPYGQMIDQKEADKRNLFFISAILLLPLLVLKGLDLLFFKKYKRKKKEDEITEKEEN